MGKEQLTKPLLKLIVTSTDQLAVKTFVGQAIAFEPIVDVHHERHDLGTVLLVRAKFLETSNDLIAGDFWSPSHEPFSCDYSLLVDGSPAKRRLALVGCLHLPKQTAQCRPNVPWDVRTPYPQAYPQFIGLTVA
jgi:hypothetical protein